VALRSIAAVSTSEVKADEGRIDRVLEEAHTDIGGEVHVDWSLPRFATLVAMRHHDLGLPTDGEYVDLHVVRLTSALVQFRRHASWRGEVLKAEIDESAAALKIDAYGLRSLDTQIREELVHFESAFGEKPKRRTA
jgi:hypothetical protein